MLSQQGPWSYRDTRSASGASTGEDAGGQVAGSAPHRVQRGTGLSGRQELGFKATASSAPGTVGRREPGGGSL